MNILVVDFLEEPGHTRFNELLLVAIGGCHEVYFLSSADYVERVGWTRNHSLPSFPWSWKGALGNRVGQCLKYLWLWRSEILDRFDVVIFSGYETVSFALLGWLFSESKVMVIDHNNLDQIEVSKLKRRFFSFIPKKICHLGLEQFIVRQLNETMQLKASWIPFPCLESDKPSMGDHGKYCNDAKIRIFAPGRSVSRGALESLAKRLVPPERFLLIARESKACFPADLSTMARIDFDDYDEILASSDYVFIGGAFGLRVSGVFFEAMAQGRPVIVERCRFGEEMKRLWPAEVQMADEFQGSAAVKVPFRSPNPEFMSRHCNDSIQRGLDIAIKALDSRAFCD